MNIIRLTTAGKDRSTTITLVSGCLVAFSTAMLLGSCSMKEEMRRIEALKQAQQASESERSTNLTGEQVFIRSCNTCHPSGRKNFGPSLIDMGEHFKTDEQLTAFIRQGVGIMPPQPPTTLNDKEMANLVDYLRKLNVTLKEQQAKK